MYFCDIVIINWLMDLYPKYSVKFIEEYASYSIMVAFQLLIKCSCTSHKLKR